MARLPAVETSLGMIADAGRYNVSRSRMLADFNRMAEPVRRWYLPPAHRAGAPVYQASAFPPAALLAARPSLADADGYTHLNANRRP